MPKYTVKVQPLGLLNAYPWPEVGETVDLPESVAKDMIASGALEEKKSAKKAASKPVKKAAAKPDESEKRPAAKADTETRKK